MVPGLYCSGAACITTARVVGGVLGHGGVPGLGNAGRSSLEFGGGRWAPCIGALLSPRRGTCSLPFPSVASHGLSRSLWCSLLPLLSRRRWILYTNTSPQTAHRDQINNYCLRILKHMSGIMARAAVTIELPTLAYGCEIVIVSIG